MTEASKRAQQKYVEKNKDKLNEYKSKKAKEKYTTITINLKVKVNVLKEVQILTNLRNIILSIVKNTQQNTIQYIIKITKKEF